MNPPTMATKWTSAILSRLFALNIAPATRPYPSATVHMPVCSRSYASASKHLSPEELEMKKKEARARNAEKRRLRYQTDPEVREKAKQHAKAQYAAINANPELLAETRERRRQRLKDPEFRDKRRQYEKAKYATDSEFRNRKLDKMRQYQNAKYATDYEYRDRKLQYKKNSTASYSKSDKTTNSCFRQAQSLRHTKHVDTTRGSNHPNTTIQARQTHNDSGLCSTMSGKLTKKSFPHQASPNALQQAYHSVLSLHIHIVCLYNSHRVGNEGEQNTTESGDLCFFFLQRENSLSRLPPQVGLFTKSK
jgi:hypothetical protein